LPRTSPDDSGILRRRSLRTIFMFMPASIGNPPVNFSIVLPYHSSQEIGSEKRVHHFMHGEAAHKAAGRASAYNPMACAAALTASKDCLFRMRRAIG
jgi:hypothetical protein